MTFCRIIFWLSIILLALVAWLTREDDDSYKIWVSAMLACLAMGSLMGLLEADNPTALDVYRGKTTLEITYRDSTAIDSVVVYKVK